MKASERLKENRIKNSLRVLAVFLLGGTLAGLCFWWMLFRPELKYFWYIQGDKFLIPTYRWHLALTSTLLLGLMGSYIIIQKKRWVTKLPLPNLLRCIVTIFIILASAPFLVVAHGYSFDPFWLMISPFLFALLVSFGLIVFTKQWHGSGLLAVITSPIAAFALALIVVGLGHLEYPYTDLVQWAVFEGLLSVACGYWLLVTDDLATKAAV